MLQNDSQYSHTICSTSCCKMTPTHHASIWNARFTQPLSGPKGASCINITKHHQLCSSHVLRHISLVYERKVILWYNEIPPGVFISRCTMTPIHSYGESFYDIKKKTQGMFISRCKMTSKHYVLRCHWCWMFTFAQLLSEQRWGNMP